MISYNIDDTLKIISGKYHSIHFPEIINDDIYVHSKSYDLLSDETKNLINLSNQYKIPYIIYTENNDYYIFNNKILLISSYFDMSDVNTMFTLDLENNKYNYNIFNLIRNA